MGSPNRIRNGGFPFGFPKTPQPKRRQLKKRRAAHLDVNRYLENGRLNDWKVLKMGFGHPVWLVFEGSQKETNPPLF